MSTTPTDNSSPFASPAPANTDSNRADSLLCPATFESDSVLVQPSTALVEAPRVVLAAPNLTCISTGTNWNPAQPLYGDRKIHSIADIQSIDYYSSQPITYLVEGLIAEATVTILSGESGGGKSTFGSALCKAINRGIPFAGLATQFRPILVLDRENPIVVLAERFERLGVKDNENFKVWGGWAPEEPPMPSDPRILEWVRSCNPKPIIFVDSFTAFCPCDENNASEVRRFMDKEFRFLANHGASVIVLANTGKGKTAQDYRGSSDIKASADIGYTISNSSANKTRLGTLRLKSFKGRFSVKEEWQFHYNDGVFTQSNFKTSQERCLRDLLIANPGITKAEYEALVADKKLTSREQQRKFVESGISSGTIHEETQEHNAKALTWVGAAA